VGEKMNFKFLSMCAAMVCFVLAIAYVLTPWLFFWMWSIEYTYPVGLAAKRSGALFLGIGVMLWQARNTPSSVARTALSRGFAVGCSGLALLGLYELMTGHSGYGIVAAIIVESFLAAAFSFVDWRAR
jgi:hypothetical protein